MKKYLFRLKDVAKRIVNTYDSSVQLFSDVKDLASDIKVLIEFYRWNLIIMVACSVMPVLYQFIQRNPEVAHNLGMFILFSLEKRLNDEVTSDNVTFIMLATKTGEGNLRIFFDLQHGFGNRTRTCCMCFLCMLVCLYLSLFETKEIS